MLYNTTLKEIETNTNFGIEYEIALFYKLLPQGGQEASLVMSSILKRVNKQKVLDIIGITDENILKQHLSNSGLSINDVSFESQNDNVGPADLVLQVRDRHNRVSPLGLSVKYANNNAHNPTGRRFLSPEQIAELQIQYDTVYLPKYMQEMKERFGAVQNWHRKRSVAVSEYYDRIRDAVISNWSKVEDKISLLSAIFHTNSPIPFWVLNYSNNGYSVKETPDTIDGSRVSDVTVAKFRKSYVAFILDDTIIGKIQVKCNNGFIEDLYARSGEPKRNCPDMYIDGLPRLKGDPFSSWDFTLGASTKKNWKQSYHCRS